MPETPFMDHFGSPLGPKHRSVQTDGLSGHLSRGWGRERWIPTCRGGDSLRSLTIRREDVGCVCFYSYTSLRFHLRLVCWPWVFFCLGLLPCMITRSIAHVCFQTEQKTMSFQFQTPSLNFVGVGLDTGNLLWVLAHIPRFLLGKTTSTEWPSVVISEQSKWGEYKWPYIEKPL